MQNAFFFEWPLVLIHDRANVSDTLCNLKGSHFSLELSDTALYLNCLLSPITSVCKLVSHFMFSNCTCQPVLTLY